MNEKWLLHEKLQYTRRSVWSGCPPACVPSMAINLHCAFLISLFIHGELPLCPVVCIIVCFCVCLLVPFCSIGKLFSLGFGVGMTVSFVCVRLCVGEAEQIKLVSSLIVFTVSSTQSVISTQTAICPNKQLKTTPVLLTLTAITASIHC